MNRASDGAVDATWGTAGIAKFSRASVDENGGIGIQRTTGRIVQAFGGDDFFVSRYLANGTIDASFGTAGVATLDVNIGDRPNSIAVQADDRIVIAGTARQIGFPTDDSTIARFTAAGAVDTTFGGGGTGFRQVDVAGGDNDVIYEIKLDARGRIHACGVYSVGATQRAFVLRLTADGVPDTTFATSGIYRDTSFAIGASPSCTISVLGDDSIVAAFMSSTNRTVLVKLAQSGGLDPSFGTAGRSTVDITAGTEQPTASAVQPDGRIVLAGHEDFASAFAARLTAVGALDTSFGGTGRVTLDFPGGSRSWADAGLVLQPDGKIVVAGDAFAPVSLRMLVYRVLPNGTLDTSFDTDGRVVLDYGAIVESDRAGVLLQDGKIVVGGRWSNGGNIDRVVARLDGTASVPDYGGANIWSSGASNSHFGICLASVVNAAASWTVGGACAASDGAQWRGIPGSRGDASVIAATGASTQTANQATFRFGVKLSTSQPPGSYQAGIVFDVLAP